MAVRHWVFVLVGIVLLAAAATTAIGTWRWVQRTVVAQGHVVRLNAGGSHPEIEFVAASGQKVSYPQGGLVAGWRVGDVVPVRYDPAAPARAPCIDRVTAIWTVAIGLLFAGLVTLGALLAVAAGWLVKVN